MEVRGVTMHTYIGEAATFNYNSDFSGEIGVRTPDGELRIPGKDILEFVAHCYVVRARISRIENMDWEELLRGTG